MEEIKMIGTLIIVVVIIVGGILGIVFGIERIFKKNEDEKWARTIQCKQIGGVWTYENYNYYCK